MTGASRDDASSHRGVGPVAAAVDKGKLGGFLLEKLFVAGARTLVAWRQRRRLHSVHQLHDGEHVEQGVLQFCRRHCQDVVDGLARVDTFDSYLEEFFF